MSHAQSLADLSDAQVRALEKLCDDFEHAWRDALRTGTPRPRLEDALSQVDGRTRSLALRELALVELGQRRQHGEKPAPADYADRLDEVARVFNALLTDHREAARVDASSEPPGDAEHAPAPDSIPGYRLVRRLGDGGIGDVFLAIQLFSTPDDALRTVALKAIRPEMLTSARHRLIMENDIRIAALLDHPNIVRILHVGPADGVLYFTMPFFKGGSLADRIQRKPLPALEAAALLVPVAQAVAYLHGQPTPVIHLDLKPGNILLDTDGKPHVADFGLARLLRSGDGKQVTVRPGGTPEYMAPEQFEGWVSPACDIYGLGAILYEMLTGRPPFVGATWGETMRQARDQDPVPPRALNATVDRGLEAICLKCLEKKPEHRYATATELAEDLERVLRRETPKALKVAWSEWLMRHLNHEIHFEAAGAWSIALLWQAILSLPAHLSVYGFLALDSPAPVYWFWLLILLPIAEWVPYLVPRQERRYDPREREILLLWVSVCVAKAIIFGLTCPLWGAVRPDDVYRFFPASMAISGLMLCLEGRLYMGRLYIFGLLDFFCSILMAIWLPIAPLLFGIWNSTVLLWMAWHIRRRKVSPGR
ncbi:MAG TPA: serine/threonine-protein kinase [Gemmataceae bacterium]|nr:serine/threonine-protein kinase [Gemmataceae bacterium]